MDNNLDYEINKELGESYLFMGELNKAEEHYQKAAGSNGVHAEPYLGLATIAVQKGELHKAHTLYSKACSVEAGDKALAGLALVEAEIGSRAKAFDLLQQALEKKPSNLVALYALVQVAHGLQRLQEVLPYLENYLETDPDNQDVRFSLAGCLKTLGHTEAAADQARRVLELNPENTAAGELLANVA